MQTVLIVLGIWLLINVLFVVMMIPPRKPRKTLPRHTGELAPAPIEQNGHQFEDSDKLLLRHVIISIALGAFFSLAPPLMHAVDSIRRFWAKRRG